MTVFYLVAFGSSLLLSFVGTWVVREIAKEHGWLASPALDRHLHSIPLPRLGGVAIFTAFLLSFGMELLAVGHHSGLNLSVSVRSLARILVPGCLIFFLGVYDDLRPVGPYTKFSVQAVAGAMLFAGGLRILDLPVLFPSYQFSWFVSLALTILWVLAITNAFNLIDGLDGLAAGSALFSTMVVFVVALLSGASLVALMTLALAGAILGFLRYNFNPATIFLGDCGSLFIGFMLSALALQGAQKAPTIIAVAIPVVSFGLPILETALSIVRRFISGRPVFTADREHIHHKLLQLGLSHRQVVITLYAVSAFFALISLFLLWPTGSSLGLILAVLGTGIWLGVQHLGYLEFGELRRVAQRTIEQRQIVINNLAIRRATEELKVTSSYSKVLKILKAAFSTNDFDAFDLRLDFLPLVASSEELLCIDKPMAGGVYRWTKTNSHFEKEMVSTWSITLDLFTLHNRHAGSLTVYRLYSTRDVQLDVNLLTSIFPIALADALDRCRYTEMEIASPSSEIALAARAG